MKFKSSNKLIKGLAGLALLGTVVGCSVNLKSEAEFESKPSVADRASSFHGDYPAMSGDFNFETQSFTVNTDHGVRLGKIDFDHTVLKGGPSDGSEILGRLNNITIHSVEHTIETMGLSQIQQNPQAFAENVRKEIETNFSKYVAPISVNTMELSNLCFDNGLNECFDTVSISKNNIARARQAAAVVSSPSASGMNL